MAFLPLSAIADDVDHKFPPGPCPLVLPGGIVQPAAYHQPKRMVYARTNGRAYFSCGGLPLIVQGDGNALLLANCTAVTVTGNGNTLYMMFSGSSASVYVDGTGNDLRWDSYDHLVVTQTRSSTGLTLEPGSISSTPCPWSGR